MTPPPSSPSGNAASGSGSGGASVASNVRDVPINIQRLADKVYRLMLADLSAQKRRANGERR